MQITAGQIYLVPNVVLKKANYSRPCMVLQVFNSRARIAYFSTKIEYREIDEVLIEITDPDFKTSGLRDSSYIVDDPTDVVEISSLNSAKLLGHATGDFRKRIEDWYGAPLV